MSYDDIQEAPSSSEADPTDTETLHPEDQSYRDTVCGIRSYMKWSFIPDHKYVCPSHQDNPWMGLNLRARSLLLCQWMTGFAPK